MNTMNLPTNYEYFERKSKNSIETLLTEHGSYMIGIDYLRDQLKIYDFGFIHRAQTIIHSFVLCKLNTDFSDVDIFLVCSRPQTNDGSIMLEFVHEKASRLGLVSMSLIFIEYGNTGLLDWYKSHGFLVQSYKQYKDKPQINVYSMRKKVYRSRS